MAGDAELTHAEGDIGSATPKGSQTPQNHGDFPSTPPIFCFSRGEILNCSTGGIKHWELKNFAGKNEAPRPGINLKGSFSLALGCTPCNWLLPWNRFRCYETKFAFNEPQKINGIQQISP